MQTVTPLSTNTHQAPRHAASTAAHYGYCAYQKIWLVGETGREHWVQPADTPYQTQLPARQLIPFTNLEYPVIDEIRARKEKPQFNPAFDPPVVFDSKTAGEAAFEIEDAFGDTFGFRVLKPLTGMNEEDAFHIFQTIQPFTYKLKDLLQQIEFDAIDRIDCDAPYTVTYAGLTSDLQPLPAHLKPIAEQVRLLMATAASIATTRALTTKEKTTQQLTAFYATGQGPKQTPDPNDRWAFAEFDEDIPRLVDNRPAQASSGSDELLARLVNALEGRQQATPTAPEPVAAETTSTSEIDPRDIEIEMLKQQIAAQNAQLQAKSRTRTPKPKTTDTNSVSVGDKVSVAGEEGTVVRMPAGKIIVRFADGSEKFVTQDELG